MGHPTCMQKEQLDCEDTCTASVFVVVIGAVEIHSDDDDGDDENSDQILGD